LVEKQVLLSLVIKTYDNAKTKQKNTKKGSFFHFFNLTRKEN